MKNYLNLFLLFYFLPFTLSAKIQLPHILSDNMVLQQKTNVKLWGYSKPDAMVVVKASWSKTDCKTRSDKNGKWLLLIPTPEAGGQYEISISDGEELKLNNVLLGEVWFCSGQSNMEMPMKGFPGQPVEGANDVILKSKKSLPIRMFTSANEFSQTPREDINGSWLENTPESVAECSAAAYYFAKCMQDVLEVPVGLVISAWGGTYIESWMSPDQLNSIAEYRNSDKEKKYSPKCKTITCQVVFITLKFCLYPITRSKDSFGIRVRIILSIRKSMKNCFLHL